MAGTVSGEVANEATVESAAKQAKYWAVVPAAGLGRRMQFSAPLIPKQYLEIRGHSILELTLQRLDQLEQLAGIVLVLSPEDTWFHKLALSLGKTLETAVGGAERALSVYNGLQALEGKADNDDWVLVHDVVRPCVALADIQALINDLSGDDTGGLLAIPVRETLKQVSPDGGVECTVPRDSYRLAATPQMFRYRQLRRALEQALKEGIVITDEAHAMEHAGHQVKLVQGGADNIKITHPEDMVLAEFILDRQGAL